MGYRITYLTLSSTSCLLLLTHLLSLNYSTLLLLKCQEIASVKHSFIVQLYQKWINFSIELEDELHTCTKIHAINWKAIKVNMNINLNLIELEQV